MGPADAPTRRGPVWSRIDWAIVVGFAATTIVIHIPQLLRPGCVHVDAISHLMFARDCVEGHGCALHLGRASVVGVPHGAVHLHILTAVLLLGGQPATASLLVVLALAGAVALLYRVGLSIGGRTSGVAAAAACLYAHDTVVPLDPSIVWNPSWVPLFAVLLLAAVQRHWETDQLRHLGFATAVLSLGMQCHLVFLVLAPLVALPVFLLPARRRVAMLAVCSAVFVLVTITVSPGMLLGARPPDLEHVLGASSGGEPFNTPVLVATLCPLILAVAWKRGRPQDVGTRRLALLLSTLLPPCLLFARIVVPGESHYVLPLIGPTALLAVITAAVATRAVWPMLPDTRRLRIALRVAQLLLLVFAVSDVGIPMLDEQPNGSGQEPTCFSMAEGVALARVMRRRLSSTYDGAFGAVRGTGDTQPYLNALAYYLPLGGREGPPTEPVDVAIHRLGARAPELPRGWSALPSSDPPGRAVVFYRSVLDWRRLEACLTDRETATDCVWTALPPRPDASGLRRSDRQIPRLRLPPGARPPRSARQLRIRVPVRKSTRSLPTLLSVSAQPAAERAWAITGARGVHLERVGDDAVLLDPHLASDDAVVELAMQLRRPGRAPFDLLPPSTRELQDVAIDDAEELVALADGRAMHYFTGVELPDRSDVSAEDAPVTMGGLFDVQDDPTGQETYAPLAWVLSVDLIALAVLMLWLRDYFRGGSLTAR